MNKQELRDLYGYAPDLIESPMQALDWHLRYFEWQGTDGHLEMLRTFFSHYTTNRQKLTVFDPETLTIERRLEAADDEYVQHYGEQEAMVINRAYTHFVAEDVCEFVEEAASSMPAAILHESDTPSPMGLVIFSRPLRYSDIMDERGIREEEVRRINEETWTPDEIDPDYYIPMPLRAVAWEETFIGSGDGSIGRGIRFWLYTDTDYMRVWRKNGGYGDMPKRFGSLPGITLIDMTGWSYNSSWSTEVGRRSTDMENHVLAMHMGLFRKYMLALWTFMAQEIVVSERQRPGRPAEKRAQRAGKNMPDDGCITVIHLRRKKQQHKDEDDEHGEVEWSHRWWVRGHWRQIVAKEGPRLVWVRPHIKGPEEKPLIIKDRIISVDR